MTAFQAVIANKGNLPGQVCPGRDELNDLADAQAPAEADFRVANHGSIIILTPISLEARDWLSTAVSELAPRWCGGLAVEPRYIGDIVSGIVDAGFSIVGSAL